VDGAGNVYIGDAHAVNSSGYPNLVEEVSAATGEIVVIAGGGTATAATTPQPATNVAINGINSLTTDVAGNLYISDFFNNLVEKVAPNGQIVVVAGGGSVPVSTTPQAATSAQLNGPTGMVIDASGNLYISDQNIGVIEKMNSAGQIVSVAGGGGAAPSTTPQPGRSVALNNPAGLAVDGAGDLYIADFSNQLVEQLNLAGQLVVVAGGGSTIPSSISQSANAAQLGLIQGVEVDGAGNLYIADGQNIGGGDNMVEKVNAAGMTLNFPFTNVGSSSVPQSLVLTNIGNQSLNLSSVSATTDFPLQTTGTCTLSPTSGQTLASGGNCSVAYLFQPTMGGVLNEAATLTDNNLNAANAQQALSFTGTGIGGTNPQLASISPSSGAGGTSVTLTGTSLSGATQVTFGASAVRPSSSTSTSVTATAPAGSGTVSVTVTTPNGTSNGESFTYTSTPAATPTFSPSAGTYTSAQTVTISSATSGATIYYTTDGSTPTTSSSVYSVPISVSATETVKALAVESGYTNSVIGSAAYSIGIGGHLVRDYFTGSGALSSSWTNTAATAETYVPAAQVSGTAVPSVSGQRSLATYTGTTFAADQYAQAAFVTHSSAGGSTGPCVHMSTTGNGYCYLGDWGIVYLLTNGTGSNGVISGCPIPASGDTIQLSVVGTTFTCTDVTTGAHASATDSTYAPGNPGMLLDQRNSTIYALAHFQAD
jgi:sugar lactone lactonase YvrE